MHVKSFKNKFFKERLHMKKYKLIIFVLAVMLAISSSAVLLMSNALNQQNQLSYATSQTDINNYQISLYNAVRRLESENLAMSDVFYAIEGLNSSMQYYTGVSEPSQNTQYIAVMDYYISALENYVLTDIDGQENSLEQEIDAIVDDLSIIADWLRERNNSETLIAHSDDDFYEVYLKLSPKWTDEIAAYQ